MSGWEYCDVSNSIHGLMICEVCKKKIDAGEYRVKETRSGDAYRTVHRSCCSNDEEWTKRDYRAYLNAQIEQKIRIDVTKLVNKWGFDDVVSIIDAMREGV